MDFSLSSSLVGSAVSNPDKLALDLQFATDKTLTARKGPTPAFTRGSSGTFVGSNGLIQSAGNNVARFDHDPVTLACKGLLIEESRTNVALYSGAIVNNIGWNGSATPSVSGTGPDNNSSYQISEVAATTIQSIANGGGTGSSQVTSVVSGTTYTGSIFVKKVAGSVDWIQITFGGAGFGLVQYANFNIGNGTVGNSAGLASGTSPRIENYGNGWYRLSISVTASATIATNNVILAFTQNTNGTTRLPSYLGSPSNSVLASLCQFEAGTFATSYIPTVTSSVIRSADVCNITGSDFSGMYNQPEGTLFVDATPQTVSQLSLVLAFNTTGSSNAHSIWKSNSGIVGVGLRWVGGTGGQSLISTAADVATTRSKLSYAYKTNDMAFAANGSLVGTDASGTMPTSTALRIGSRDDGTGFYLNGHIAVVRCYKKRLSNAKLQALTASVIVLSGIGFGSGPFIVAPESPAFSTYDIDAQNYITAVEAADGQSLETATRLAINTFIEGCKSDGVWNAIKASCILAGARTLSGALVPLVGTAPTNANFVSSDYDRKTGLVGNGSTKFINSNRNNNADPRNNYHASVYLTSIGLDNKAYIGAGGSNTTGTTHLLSSAGSFISKNRFPTNLIGGLASLGFLGHSRSAGDAIKLRHDLTEYLANYPSSEPYPYNAFVFARNVNDLPQAATSGRISFYSIGENLDLALLNARISNLMTTFSSSIS